MAHDHSHHGHDHSSQDHSGHDHSHGHHHHAPPTQWNFAFTFGIALNLSFVVIESVYGYFAHSLALIADAGHNLSDVLGLALAFGAHHLAQKRPSNQFTYGYKSSTILASLLNAGVLLIAVGGIVLESFQRLRSPEPIHTQTVMWVATIGILINGGTAMMFFSGRHSDLNIRGAFIHMMGDMLISVGVVLSAFLIQKTEWLWIDPAVSFAVAIMIVWSTWHLLKDSLNLALAGVPRHIQIDSVRNYLQKTDGVSHVHDLHIWALSTTDVAMTAHLVMPDGTPNDFVITLCSSLKEEFKIQHVTIQVETNSPSDPCCSLET